jgi:hypothetical protein
MAGKLEPFTPGAWHEYYREAEKRRRQAGWHRREASKPRKRAVDPGRVLAIVMGCAAVTVILCLVLPS